MADNKKCPYCGSSVTRSDEICPSCGAPNMYYVSGSEGGARRPRTIEELQDFCASKGMPLEKMRFFIGTNEPSPKCFRIYREGDRFIVYKNKADGSRSVRYEGPDEAFAVKELYEKLLEEHRLRRSGGTKSRKASSYTSSDESRKNRRIIIGLVVLIIVTLLSNRLGKLNHRKDGYYRSGDGLYYRYGTSWYRDTGFDEWISVFDFPEDDYGSYYVGSDYDDSWGGSDFTDSSTWDDLHTSDDSDSDWDYDYDDWDFGDTDWDSDW